MPNQRVLMVPSAIGLSHLTRLVLIARELRRAGSEVRFAHPDERQILRAEGFEALPAADARVTDFAGNVFAAYSPALVEQCVRDELAAIEAFRPDVVVGDFRLTAAISTRVAGLPYVSVVNGYMTNYFDPMDALLPRSASRVKHVLLSRVASAIQWQQKRQLATPFRAVARRHGLRGLASLHDFLEGDRTLVADVPQFCPLHRTPPSLVYVGPLIWEGGGGELPAHLRQRDRARRLIYATTGNTGGRALLDLVVGAFGPDRDLDLVLTTGVFLDPATVPRAANVHVERFLPGSKLLAEAALAIHCGGNGTTYQAMRAGVPALVVPFNSDQRINAWLALRRHVGIPLSPGGLTASRLRLAAGKLLEDAAIRSSLDGFRRLLAGIDGPRRAADEILAFPASRDGTTASHQGG